MKAKKVLSSDDDDSQKENNDSNNTSLFRTSTQQDDAEDPDERTFLASPIALPDRSTKKPVIFNSSSDEEKSPVVIRRKKKPVKKIDPNRSSQSSEPVYLINKKYRPSQVLWKKLWKFQKEGVEWMFRALVDSEYRGGILGDDMGLGKTLQTITFIDTVRRNEMAKTILLVLPVSLESMQ